MNKLVLAVFALVLLSACDQGDKELKELKSKRAELNKKIGEMNLELDSINSKLARIQKIDVQESIIPYTIVAQPFQHTIFLQSNITFVNKYKLILVLKTVHFGYEKFF